MMAVGFCAAGSRLRVVPQMSANGPRPTREHRRPNGQDSLSERVGIPRSRICRKVTVGSRPWTRVSAPPGAKASSCTPPLRKTWHASRASTCQFQGKLCCKPALSRMDSERSPAMASTGPISNADSAITVDSSPAPGTKSDPATEAVIGGVELNFRGFPAVPVRIANHSGETLVGQLIEAGTTDINILCHGFRSSMGREVSSIIGHSKGGNVVILYAAKYDDVPKVVNVSGRFQMDRGLMERFGEDGLQKLKTIGYLDVQNDADAGNMQYRVTLASLEERLATDMKAAAEAIHKSRVMTVHGSDDAVVPAEDGRSFAQSIQCSHKLVILEGASHRYTEHTSELSSAVVDFLASDQE
ncbi:hypothetical protein CBR_g47125 [Chara braunii]|uniref:Uncharacterized protein n=1 Tax=Chara braunii TaxID=69332 RepID=A0A388M1K7_CHABU|nr:hypothetical protein CBR_g47125 [Chara braunii]|eukprot:GBG88426.1 hypothetical protein CBR_g47125 [Chara braunii]